MSDFTQAWETLFGTYQPIISYDADLVPLFSSVDWGYVGRVAWFGLVTLCLFKLLGGLFKNGKR